MKRGIISLGIILLLLWSVYNNNTGPYSGTYNLKQNPNLVLKLKDDHTFVLSNAMGKNSEFTEGKYTVDDDNNIALFPEKDSPYKALTGKVRGSIIEMSSRNEEFIKK